MNKRQNTRQDYGRFVSVDDLKAYTGLGRSTAEQVAKESGAAIKVGRRVVYDLRKIDAYMESLTH